MYKLFIMLRYLRSRVLAYFAALAVTLCVAMMLIAVSVMTGFLDKIETAAKGLFGEIVMDGHGHQGLARYDAFMAVAAGGTWRLDRPLVPDATGTAFVNPAPAEADVWALRRHAGPGSAIRLPARGRLLAGGRDLGQVRGVLKLGTERAGPPRMRLDLDESGIATAATTRPADLELTDVTVELPGSVEGVEAATPFILTFGMMRVPQWSDYRQAVQVIGIRLPERAAVTDFEDGLFVQHGWREPTFRPPPEAVLDALSADRRRARELLDRELKQAASFAPGTVPAELEMQINALETAVYYGRRAAENVRDADADARRFRQLEEALQQAIADGDDEAEMRIRQEARRLDLTRYQPGPDGVILGTGLPNVVYRTDEGEEVHVLVPGQKVLLDTFPLGRPLSGTDLEPARGAFSVVDLVRSGVASIDSQVIYLDFDRLQVLNNMTAPPRTSQIHVKVDASVRGERALEAVAGQVRRAWGEFAQRFPDASPGGVRVQTWRQRQRAVVAPIAAQRVLVMIMFGIMSLTVVVLIFVLFYTIVVQKTREIGVLKALGASSGGVAQIFLGYGAVIGLIGGLLGAGLGWLFVHRINPIHDWVGRTFGLVIWDRQTFMFDKIPNEVYASDAVLIVVGAVLAGVVGAVLPASIAAFRRPVESLRYE